MWLRLGDDTRYIGFLGWLRVGCCAIMCIINHVLWGTLLPSKAISCHSTCSSQSKWLNSKSTVTHAHPNPRNKGKASGDPRQRDVPRALFLEAYFPSGLEYPSGLDFPHDLRSSPPLSAKHRELKHKEHYVSHQKHRPHPSPRAEKHNRR